MTKQLFKKAFQIIVALTSLTLLVGGVGGAAFFNVGMVYAAGVSIIDDGGSNDPNGDGQNDLTQLTGDDLATTDFFEVSWSWDEPTTIKGGNASNACAMFDTDGDGNVNYSFCVEVSYTEALGYFITDSGSGTDSVPDFPAWIECSDAKDDRCTQPTRLADPYPRPASGGKPAVGSLGTTTCTIAEADTDPFPPAPPITDGTPGGAGDDYPTDLTVTCSIDSSLPEPQLIDSTYKFVNVCSYPSAGNDGNNNPFDCVVTPGSGFLTIVKNADPSDGTAFTFNASGASTNGDSSWTINGSGSVEQIPYAPTTTLDLTEAVPAGWKLDSASCVIQPATATGTPDAGFPHVGPIGKGVQNLEIKSGTETVCTFNDSQAENPPSILVTKTADPTSLDEPGGNVTFSILVENNSTSAATLDSLVDDIYGDLTNLTDEGGTVKPQLSTTCAVPKPLAASDGTANSGLDTYSCSFTATVSGNAGDSETDIVTATASNAAGSDSAQDSATVTVNDIQPSITVVKDNDANGDGTFSDSEQYDGTGDVSFQVVVTNNTAEALTLDSISDNVHTGATITCSATVIPANGSVTCTFTGPAPTDENASETDTVTVNASDDDGNSTSGSDTSVVTTADIQPSITVVKDNDANGDGTFSDSEQYDGTGDVSFQVVVTNNTAEALTLDSISDNVHTGATITCSATVIPANGSVTCTFTGPAPVDDDASETDTVTVNASDDDGNSTSGSDTSVVTTADIQPSITVVKDNDANGDGTFSDSEQYDGTGDVSFQVVVTNNTAEALTLDSISDNVHTGATITCSATVIPANGSVTCTFTGPAPVDDDASETDTVTVNASDDDGNSTSGSDTSVVTTADILPDITVTKTAENAPASVPETGGDVTFTFVVNNNSTEAATITSLSDSVFGTLTGDADCQVDTVLAGGASCSFAATFSIPAGDYPGTHTNVFTAVGADDDGNSNSGQDDEDVTYTDVLPDITVTKTAENAPASVPETGGDVTFTFVVNNNSTEAATITSLSDSVFGTLTGDADCQVDTVLAGGASCSFAATFSIPAGDYPGTHTNVFTAVGADDDGNSNSGQDDEDVTYTDVLPDITVTKTAENAPASVPETGGDVTFTFVVNNNSTEAATITSLSDSVFGTLTGDADCQVDTVLAGGASCSFAATFSIPAGDYPGTHTNVFTAVGADDDGNSNSGQDDEDVTYTDVLPDITVTKTAENAPASVPETGGDVTFTFVVNNNSTEAATITSLSDSVFGTLTGDADCQVDTVLAGGASCSFAATFSIPAGDYPGTHTNVFTAVGADDDGNSNSGQDDEDVTYTDVLPDITVTKTAENAPASVPETGGDVTFTFVVNNNSTEAATITSLSDSVFGTLTGDADCQVDTVLAGGASCSFAATFSIPAGDYPGTHTNVFTAVGADDDGNSNSGQDDEDVTYTDVLPDITVTKTAENAPASVPETGGDVTFTFVVNNNSTEAATITSLSDSVFGTLTGDADCQVDTVLAGGASCSFAATFSIPAGDYPGTHTNVFTAVGADDDGNSNSGQDDEDVTYTDVLPDVSITKTANPTSVPETGANVEFTIVVTNNSLEDATIDSLVDSDFDLVAHCADAVGTVLASGASYTCVFTEFISGDFSGPDHENTATVVASDDDGNSDTESATETVDFTDVLPDVTITKVVNLPVIPEPGGIVEFTIVVTNNSLEDATIDSLVDTDFDLAANCPDAVGTVLAFGDSYTCVFSENISADHENTVTVVASDNDGNSDTESATATVDLVPPGVVTDSSLCEIVDPFRLIFTPDMQRFSSSTPFYKLSDSNPGQFFYNVLLFDPALAGQEVTIDLVIPYPFVTQGGNPVHVYDTLGLNEYGCFDPQEPEVDHTTVPEDELIDLLDYATGYPDGSTTVAVTFIVPDSGFAYVNIHLDYGLEKTKDWERQGANATNDGLNDPSLNGVTINEGTVHTFTALLADSPMAGTTDTIENTNEYKQVRGFGGLVQYAGTLDPVVGVDVQLIDPDGTVIETMTTDSDGWYLSDYVHKGKATTYTLKLVSTGEEIQVAVGGRVKFGEGSFLVPIP